MTFERKNKHLDTFGPAPEDSLPCVCSVKINIEHYNLNELALIQKCLFR